MRHLDLNTAFLENVMKKEIYITFPKGIELSDQNTLLVEASNHQIHAKLIKRIYDLKQAEFNWFETLDQFLIKIVKMIRIRGEPEIYVQRNCQYKSID